MRTLRIARLMVLALLLSVIPAASHASVFISVGFAPPPLPVYEQPPCPEPGLIWTPGYWAYGPDGYYWVPGTWVPAPYVGALWTPGYWGWSANLYVWHPGYWGPQVGYYGGVNYGFGYFGIGFLGGRWHDGYFDYNTAVWRVDRDRIRHTYDDRRDFDRYRVERDSRVSYSGGPGGVHHLPSAEERMAERDQHMARTRIQTEHIDAAMRNHDAYARFNGGHPHDLAAQRPLRQGSGPAPQVRRGGQPRGENPFNNGSNRAQAPQQRQQPEYRQQPQQRQQPEYRQPPQQRQQQYRQQPQQRQQPEYRQPPQQRQQQYRQQPQQRPEPQVRQQPERRAAPQPRAEPQRGAEPRGREARPQNDNRGHDR
jgi:WXXGXW repeat (2 copies)